jgi:hypothetical protein
MHFSTILVTAFAAISCAAPTFPQVNLDAADPKGVEAISEYFNLLASKVQASRLMSAAPICDMSRAQMPVGTISLPYLLDHISMASTC